MTQNFNLRHQQLEESSFGNNYVMQLRILNLGKGEALQKISVRLGMVPALPCPGFKHFSIGRIGPEISYSIDWRKLVQCFGLAQEDNA